MNNQTTFTLQIPVRAYVRKIILREHGPEPIRITQQSLLGKNVLAMLFDYAESEVPQHGCFGEPLSVEISTRLSRHFQKYEDVFQSGFYFEKVAQQMLVTYILGGVRAGRKAWDAMRDFLALYDISEDEYAAEAAYMVWKTWKTKHPEMTC